MWESDTNLIIPDTQLAHTLFCVVFCVPVNICVGKKKGEDLEAFSSSLFSVLFLINKSYMVSVASQVETSQTSYLVRMYY